MAAKKGLGKGLESLISNRLDREAKESVQKKDEKVSRETFLPISKIEPNRNQPRRHFDEDALKELADSIRVHGVISPLIVHEKGNFYEITAGERRWRAARLAGLKEVPVLVKNYEPQELFEIALIENLQRENLNAVEEAVGYQKLIKEYKLTQDEVSKRVGKSRVAVTNALRLLKLDEHVQQMLIDGTIFAGQARALLSIEDNKLQAETADKVVKEGMSTRDTEAYVKKLLTPGKKKEKEEKPKNASEEAVYRRYEENLKRCLGTKVSIQRKDGNKGKIEIEYYSSDEFERLMELLGVPFN
ncbi:MAG: ParB/RepB/Spo0J family partition protein [Lachnospiraceae bacterium]|nr:ParB/RepB/Spo0J family partition protein [Lachnospiraceae bacterium]